MKTLFGILGWIIGTFLAIIIGTSLPGVIGGIISLVCLFGGPYLGSKVGEEIEDERQRQKYEQEAQRQRYYAQQAARDAARRNAERAALEAKLQRQREQERLREIEDRKTLYITLPACVQSWSKGSYGNLPYKYFVDYYPYNRYKDIATMTMKSNWHLVWNFKNDDTITHAAHENAMRTVISRTEQLLKQTFGDKVKYLTFCCLTASTAAKTDARFKDFAKQICKDLKMENGLDHITILQDATPKHLGGTGIPRKSYDTSFFRGKYIVLFDDVCTSGSSIEQERRYYQSIGANVVCAITIAKTV